MTSIEQTLRAALTPGLRARDAVATSAIRSALSALDNASAVPVHTRAGAIEASAVGVGAAEAARRELTDGEARGIVQREIDERLTVASQLPDEAAVRVRSEAAILVALLS